MNVVASGLNIYLKCTSYDKELNNNYHLTIFTIRRVLSLVFFGLFYVYR